IYVSAAQIRQYGLRKGDLIEGTARPQPNGTARGKFRPLLAVDTVNGRPPGLPRPHFDDLTPLYPDQRLRLEDGDPSATARIIDLIAPIGKGQRGLIVAPPKAGKTMVLQAIATAIANSHPEVVLMLVLVGERPEEVTDLRRSVRGEVIFSTFDQAAERDGHRAGQAPGGNRRRRDSAARFDHPAGPGPRRIPGRRHAPPRARCPRLPAGDGTPWWTRPGTPPPTPNSSARSSGPANPAQPSRRATCRTAP